MNAVDVTGSCIYIRFADKQILLECGLHQSSSNSYLDSYRINSAKFKFNPSEIDYVFICHSHIDHEGLLPRLVAEGFKGKIILNSKTAIITESLLKNCAFILNDEARILSKRYKREYKPIYNENDVFATLDLFSLYDEVNTVFTLDDKVSFQWLKNSHCVGSVQLQLILNDNMRTKKILYTSDIGALKSHNHYVTQTEIPTMFNDYVIMESTYGSKNRINKRNREYDIKHLRTITDTVTHRGGSLILPCFSFARTQELLTTFYELFGNDSKFKIPIIIDSKLSCEITDKYSQILDMSDIALWDKVMKWSNVKFIKEKEDSRLCIADHSPKIVLSSSGFCTNGRIVNYLSEYLKDAKSAIVFSGYTGDNPSYLSYRIKNYKNHKTININKKPVANKADCITLGSFSSHAGHNDLVSYGSNLNCNMLVLVHGAEASKIDLRDDLEKSISKNNKSYKVKVAQKDMIIRL